MLVKVLNFGTNWWARPGRDPQDPCRFTRHAAYYNSTGVRCGRKVRRHWVVPGLVRFNGAGDFTPHLLNRSLGKTFECSEVGFRFGGNRLLVERKHSRLEQADWHLVVVAKERHGHIDFASANWKSRGSRVIAASQLRGVQEAMLLMKADDWVHTTCGFWQLRASKESRFGMGLELIGAEQPASE